MKRYLLGIILLLNALSLTGGLPVNQAYTLRGTVLDLKSKEPLVGAVVRLEGSSDAAVADIEGKFVLTGVPSLPVRLEATSVGFEKQVVTVEKEEEVIIYLIEQTNSLSEVVVIGYGEVKRQAVTGAISSVSGRDIAKVPVPDATTALAGRAAGVQVSTAEGSPGANISIKIRGGGSITQSNEPLYVIDGFPQTEGMRFLDPTDIESIEILKDASSTAIYGARGANGVVLVTTKKGKNARTTVSYDMYYGAKKINRTIPVLNPYQYVLLDYERSMGEQAEIDRFTQRYGTFDQLRSNFGNRAGINWQDEVFGGTANTQYHKIAVSGGNKDTRFNFFYSRNKDEGIMVNSGSKKNIAKLSFDHTAGEKLSASASINYTEQEIYGVGSSEGNNRFNKLQNILWYRPTIGISGNDQDLVESDMDPALVDDSGNVLQNPRTNAIAEERKTYLKTLYLNASLSYKVTKFLTYRGLVGLRTDANRADLFNGSRTVNARRTGGPNGSVTNTELYNWSYSNTLTFDYQSDLHSLEIMAGQEEWYRKEKMVRASTSMFPNDDIGLNDLSQGTVPGIPQSRVEDERLLSFFGRVNYGYANKYLFTASLRADGSSKFGSANKFGYFPSVSAAWRLIEEDFLKGSRLFSDFKLRASYGKTGNNRIGNYLSLALLQAGYYPVNDVPSISVGSYVLPNPNLKWETTGATNIGLDVGILNQRIQLTAEYYNNRTDDLLLATEVPYSSGYATVQMNIGSTRNKGLEFTVNAQTLKRKDFSWETNFNIAFNRNKVLSLNSGQELFYAESGFSEFSQTDYIIRVGQPVGQMYGYVSDGLYTVDDFNYNPANQTYTLKDNIAYNPNVRPQPGYLKLADLDGDGLVNPSDRTVIGNANPKHIGGITNTFTYKNLDLSVFLNWSYGNQVFNANRLYNSQTYLQYRNSFAEIADRWMTINEQGALVTDPAQLAAMNEGKTVPSWQNGADLRFYDKMVENGSFLRLNNITLGYALPKPLLARVKINGLRFYGSVYNLHNFTSYSGYDPEVSTRNSSGITPGVDFGAYPRSRYVVIGANVSF